MKQEICVLLLLLLGLTSVKTAPSFGAMPACLTQDCDLDSGPVCAIDASGVPKNFENRCTAMFAFCRFGSFFAEVKPGEC
ncbi:hypothetical protein JTB14_025377 [Gonioctena quinquepunctata]|nr:hypothetical protein JTB14_025377 [Gonioctena quinquepunctata]